MYDPKLTKMNKTSLTGRSGLIGRPCSSRIEPSSTGGGDGFLSLLIIAGLSDCGYDGTLLKSFAVTGCGVEGL
jgi:hypothetical protein